MDKYADMFKALGNATRLRIFFMLRVKTLCVCEIREIIPFSMSTLSNHLKILKDAGIITSFKENKFINFQLNTADSVVEQILKIFENMEDEEIEKDRKRVEKVDRNLICGIK